ncbi:hypothetical protein [Nitrosopumilus sp. S4]
MGSRITIMLDDDVMKKLRTIQAKQIRDSAQSVSFSKIINQQLQKTLK